MSEYTVHRQLKAIYAGEDETRAETSVAGYRIDATRPCGELVEIQHSPLGKLTGKVRRLLDRGHRVRIVKPIVAQKWLVRVDARGREISRRRSPRRGRAADLFHELVNFVPAFPHPRLVLELLLIELEEHRAPGTSGRRWKRDHVVADQHLLGVHEIRCFRTAADLAALLPPDLPARFDTGEIARALPAPRQLAQRMAFCLRETGALVIDGKRGNALVYRREVA